MKSLLVTLIGLTATAYLLNPSFGLFELIPDALPFVGNLDEGAAVTLLLMCLRYFGLDVTKLFERSPKKEKSLQS